MVVEALKRALQSYFGDGYNVVNNSWSPDGWVSLSDEVYVIPRSKYVNRDGPEAITVKVPESLKEMCLKDEQGTQLYCPGHQLEKTFTTEVEVPVLPLSDD